MKRRDILTIVPWAAAGAVSMGKNSNRLFPFVRVESGQGSAAAPAPEPFGVSLAEVRPHNGSPALFLDGKPVFAAINWVSGPTPDKWDFEEQAGKSAGTGIHIYAFDVGKGTEWIGPGRGRPGDFDFSSVEARFGRVIQADPKALFHLRVYLETGHDDWWEKAYPAECEVLSDGRRNGMSFASRVWREQAKDFLRAYIGHLRKAGLFDRVIAYQVGAGHTGEWVKGESSMYTPCGDFSGPMRAYFREWLRKRYQGDENKLRAAWRHAPTVTFDTAAVPAAERQLEAGQFTFRDPAAERNVIDYFAALADLCADAVVDLCRTVKEATDGQRLAGAFYGYLLDLAWNGGFFKERPDSDYSTYQRSGHLGLRKVLASPDVDFLASPYSYGFRGMGGDSPSMLPAESVRLHGKLLLIEDDTRTHVDSQDPNYGQVKTYGDSRTILRRNLAHFLTHAEGAWWALWKVDASKEPRFGSLLREFREAGEKSMDADRTSAAEVAVLLDDESFFYETCRYNLDIPLVFQQRLWGLPRLGAPFDVFLLDDFLAGRLRPYMLYIFLNPFSLDEGRRRALSAELRREKRTALWIYAPGFIKGSPGLENMEELAGIRFGLGEQAWGPIVHITDFDHPITKGLDQGLFWGTNNKLAPLFHVDDPEARILGEVVYSQGNCRPGFAVKDFAAWRSVYSAAPNLPAGVLRNIARWAGVHIYSDAGDVLYANRSLLGVHTLAGGRRMFRLPRRAPVVHDIFERKTLARGAAEFEVVLEPRSTYLYSIGDGTSTGDL
jgi:beta-galactosidase